MRPTVRPFGPSRCAVWRARVTPGTRLPRAARHWYRPSAKRMVSLSEPRATQRAGGMAMTTTATEGQAMIRSFLEHEHDELATGLNQLHDLAEELSQLSV